MQVVGRLLGSWRGAAVALTLSAVTAIVFIVGIYLVHASWPFTPDSASYIEMARGIRTGMGTVSRPWEGCEEWMLNPLFPPGFPALLAAVSLATGLREEVHAPYLLVGLGAILPVLVWWALKPVIGSGWACLVSVLVGLSASAIWSTTHVLSDMPFLLLVVLSFGLLARAATRGGGLVPWVVSGMIAGAALWVRNAGVAVIAAYGAVALLAIVSARHDRRIARGTLVALAGAVAAASTLYLRNTVVFGDPQPYEMPPGSGDFTRNARVLAQEIVADMAGFREARLVVWDVLLALPAVVLVAWLAGRFVYHWREADMGERHVIAWLVSYTLLGSAMLVVASSVYSWGEPINARHAMQYSWALWGVVFWVIARTMPSSRSWLAQGAVAALALATVVFVGSRGIAIADAWRNVTAVRLLPWDALQEGDLGPIPAALVRAERRRRVAEDVAAVSLPHNALLYAKDPYPVRIALGADVRKLTGRHGNNGAHCGRPYYAVHLKGRDHRAAIDTYGEGTTLYDGSVVTIRHPKDTMPLYRKPPAGAYGA